MSQESRLKITSFTDLVAWQKGHKLAIQIYTVTKEFPKEEKFGLTMQLRRSAVSITSNIAEGFSRQSFNDKLHFYVMAQGSVTELQNQLLLARDVKYLEVVKFNQAAEQAIEVHKLVNGLIKSTREKANA